MNNSPKVRSPIEREMALGLIGSLSIWHWLIVLVVVLLLFGRNKISDVMGDVAKGIKSFKRGMAEDDETAATPRPIERADAAATAPREEQRNAR